MKSLIPVFMLSVSGLHAAAQINPDSLNIIDYHVHTFSPELIKSLARQGFDMHRDGFQFPLEDKPEDGSVENILFNNPGIKMLLISSGYAYQGDTTLDATARRKLVEIENNLLRKAVMTNPDRYVGFYGIDPLEDWAIDEILRCHEELHLNGIKLHLQGCHVDLADPVHLTRMLEVFRVASSHRIPLLIHNNAEQLNSGTVYAQTFRDHLLEKTDSLTIIFAHSGGGGGYYWFTHDFLNVMSQYLKEPTNRTRHKLYFELSGTVLGTDYPGKRPAEDLLSQITEIGEEHFLFGSDYPFLNVEAYIRMLDTAINSTTIDLISIIERDIFDELRGK
jgi:predicted TIM-barrel fold metal-dependent hydrolase